VAEQRDTVRMLVVGGLSLQRACALVGLHRSTFRYVAHPTDDSELLAQLEELAHQHPRYGYRRISVLVSRTQDVNEKRIRRLWRLHQLQVRPKVRRRTHPLRPPYLRATHPRHIWAYDFVEDALADGTTIRILTVMDEFTREGLALDVALTSSAERVISVLKTLIEQHGTPQHLRVLAIEPNLWQRQSKPGLWNEKYKRCISSLASPGKMGRRSVLTVRCVMNVSTGTFLDHLPRRRCD
jgi:putative transposase